MTIEVTPTNPKRFSVFQDLGCAASLSLGDAEREEEKKNARYIKGDKIWEKGTDLWVCCIENLVTYVRDV